MKIREIEEARRREQREYEKTVRKMEEMIAKQDMVIGKMTEQINSLVKKKS